MPSSSGLGARRRRSPRRPGCCSSTPPTQATPRCRPFSTACPRPGSNRAKGAPPAETGRRKQDCNRRRREVVPVRSVRKPWWQQATALVTVSTGGVITGFNFVPGAAATMTSPTSVPLHLLALQQGAQPATLADLTVGGDNAGAATGDAQLRAAIVNVAGYYLRLARTRTPAQMETLIWDNTDGSVTSHGAANHGASCAAFASLTLELAAQAVGQQSWVTGGISYPWELPAWADVRVQTNPDSPGIVSMVADASEHGRWHPLGDGYRPAPGDWVVFNGHVEVLTQVSGSALDTIGADSLPNLTVNAHSYATPASAGVVGFIDNGNLKAATTTVAGAGAASGDAGAANAKAAPSGKVPSGKPGAGKPGTGKPGTGTASAASAEIPGVPNASALDGASGIPGTGAVKETGSATETTTEAGPSPAEAQVPGAITPVTAPTTSNATTSPTPASTPAPTSTPEPAATPKAAGTGQGQPAAKPGTGSATTKTATGSASSAAAAQQAFLSKVGPGGALTAKYHNLFGIKGAGPAGSVTLPTSEYEDGRWVTIDAQFAVYHNDAESITDHAELLATSGYYTRAMADRAVPDAFANHLTGVYATDPGYGANLIALMKLYNLYQFDSAGPTAPAPASAPASAPSTTPAPVVTPSAPRPPRPPPRPAAPPPRPPAWARRDRACRAVSVGDADPDGDGHGPAWRDADE